MRTSSGCHTLNGTSLSGSLKTASFKRSGSSKPPQPRHRLLQNFGGSCSSTFGSLYRAIQCLSECLAVHRRNRRRAELRRNVRQHLNQHSQLLLCELHLPANNLSANSISGMSSGITSSSTRICFELRSTNSDHSARTSGHLSLRASISDACRCVSSGCITLSTCWVRRQATLSDGTLKVWLWASRKKAQ